MGKPYGLGEISIRINGGMLASPSGTTEMFDPKCWIEQFTTAISGAADGSFDWKSSIQVQSLLKAADPARINGERLDYMALNMEDRNGNAFQNAKNKGEFLPPFSARWRKRWRSRGKFRLARPHGNRLDQRQRFALHR